MRTELLELLRALSLHDVDFVLVGGVAAILEGAPIATFDLDIVYEGSPSNLERLANALAEMDAVYRDPMGRRIFPTLERLRDQRLNLLETRHGLLDAMQEIGRGWRHAEVLARAHPVEVGGLSLRVLELAAIIESKEAADRDKDRAQLPVLRRTLELRGSR